MGMYTELLLKCEIKHDAPSEVMEVLRGLFAEDYPLPDVLPDHPFFSKDRWQKIGSGSSHSHVPKAFSDLAEPLFFTHYLFSRSDFKNYDSEAQEFLDWVQPYLDHIKGDCIGWLWYEEWDCPALLFYMGADEAIRAISFQDALDTLMGATDA